MAGFQAPLTGRFSAHADTDGLSLDDKRLPVSENDLPNVRERWKARSPKMDKDRTSKAFLVRKKEIVAYKYDLSLNRYGATVHEEITHEEPKAIIGRLALSKPFENPWVACKH